MYRYDFSPVCKLRPRKPVKPVVKPIVKKKLSYTKKRTTKLHRRHSKKRISRKRRHRSPSIRHITERITERIVTKTKPGTPVTQTYNESWICNDNGICKLVRKETQKHSKSDMTPLVSPYDVGLDTFATGLDGLVYQSITTKHKNFRKWARCGSSETQGIC
jgi:hypothetical protein